MAADADVANEALSLLGEAALVNLTPPDHTEAARLANRFFWLVVDEVLVDHPWNFALVRSPELASTPPAPYDWNFRYALPTDPYCLRVLETNYDDVKEPWAVEGRYLLMNVNAVKIKYVSRVTTIGSWAPLFRSAVVYGLAAKLAYPITESVNVSRDMKALYDLEMRRARTNDGLEGPPRTIRSSTLIDVRR